MHMQGPGRPKKARRTKAEHSDGKGGEWSTDDASLSDSQQQDDSDDERLVSGCFAVPWNVP